MANANISAVLTVYYFDLTKEGQKEKYNALVAERRGNGVKCWDTQSPYSYDKSFNDFYGNLDKHVGRASGERGMFSAPIEIESKFIFDDQMNTGGALNARLHDWVEIKFPNKDIKHGYYVESEELKKVRDNRYKCGYCGYQCDKEHATEFCPKCLGSQYLTAEQLHLTRMQSINNENRKKLSAAELAERIPLYQDAQIKGTTERNKAYAAARRAKLIEEHDKTVENATIERDGMLWLMDHGITAEPIYYNHTGVFCFGWRSPVDPAIKPALLQALDGFPFNFEIK